MGGEPSENLEELVHDVRTPLATIRALTQLSSRTARSQGNDKLAAQLERVDAQVERIRALLDRALENGRHLPQP